MTLPPGIKSNSEIGLRKTLRNLLIVHCLLQDFIHKVKPNKAQRQIVAPPDFKHGIYKRRALAPCYFFLERFLRFISSLWFYGSDSPNKFEWFVTQLRAVSVKCARAMTLIISALAIWVLKMFLNSKSLRLFGFFFEIFKFLNRKLYTETSNS